MRKPVVLILVLLPLAGCSSCFKNARFFGQDKHELLGVSHSEYEVQQQIRARGDRWHRFRMQNDVSYRDAELRGTRNERSHLDGLPKDPVLDR